MDSIFNRIPAISEDTLHYIFYLPSELADYTSATTLAACIQDFAETLLPADFLWHRDGFEVKVVLEDVSKTYLLEGHMRVGDCVDDEWCTVWLLKEISSKWDLAISVSDSDGEFLLIEAADALPRWVKPENSDNRVWIHNSRLHLIDISHVSPPSRQPRRKRQKVSDDDEQDGRDDWEDYLAVEDALKLLRDPHTDTFAPPAVERLVLNRISEYPAVARQHIHTAKAYIPLDIAKALSVSPSLVQKAVEAFYTRDGTQLRSAHRMSRFPPHTFVLATIRMTRTAYAQLAGQKFYPPKIFGRWNEREGTREWRWRDIGMKIAVGFEILYQESKGRSEMNTSVEGLRSAAEAKKDALRRNPDYNTYIQNLLTTGYFKGEMQGSHLWNQLEDKAAGIFVETRKEESSSRPSFTTLVNSAVSQAPADFIPSDLDEESDEWLNIDAENFDDMLQRNQNSNRTRDAMDVDQQAADRPAATQASQLRDLASKVEEFIEGEGDVEGAEFVDEIFSDEEMDSNDDSDEDEDEASVHIQDPEARQAAMDNLVPKLDPGDYGKMPPSFHSNSQRVAPSTMENDTSGNRTSDQLRTQQQNGTSDSVSGGSKPIRQPILPRDKFEGVDSDDETDEENPDDPDSEDEEDKPQVVGDIEIDMGEEEDEFLEFARQSLGISDAQWKDILEERKKRGAFVPKTVLPPIKLPTVETPSNRGGISTGAGPTANPNLDSFEAVMKAMEAELNRSTSASSRTAATTLSSSATAKQSASAPPDAKELGQKGRDKGKGKAVDRGKAKAVSFASVSDDDGEDDDQGEAIDIEAAMEAELKAVLERGDDDLDEDGLGSANIDYNLIKNFLESLRSQAGTSGPVSNLAGRLQPGWQIPK